MFSSRVPKFLWPKLFIKISVPYFLICVQWLQHRDALKSVCKDLRGCCDQGGGGVFSNVPLITWDLTARATKNSSGKWKDCICCRMHLSYINDAKNAQWTRAYSKCLLTRLILWDKWDGNFCCWQGIWGVFIFSRMISLNVLKLLFH